MSKTNLGICTISNNLELRFTENREGEDPDYPVEKDSPCLQPMSSDCYCAAWIGIYDAEISGIAYQ